MRANAAWQEDRQEFGGGWVWAVGQSQWNFLWKELAFPWDWETGREEHKLYCANSRPIGGLCLYSSSKWRNEDPEIVSTI